jgi:alpha-galactosidase
MIEIGNGQMLFGEERAHFTLWCLIKSPLLLGMDLRSISDQALSIISNEELILWNQDRLGIQGHRVNQQVLIRDGEKEVVEVWAAPLDRGGHAVVLFNRGSVSQRITANWEDLGIPSAKAMQVRDVWKHQDVGVFASNFTSDVNPHDIVAIKMTSSFADSNIY